LNPVRRLGNLADGVVAGGEVAFLPESGGIGDNIPAMCGIADNYGPVGQAFLGAEMELVAGETEVRRVVVEVQLAYAHIPQCNIEAAGSAGRDADPAGLEHFADPVMSWQETADFPVTVFIGDRSEFTCGPGWGGIRDIANNDGPVAQGLAGAVLELVAGEAEGFKVCEVLIGDVLARHDYSVAVFWGWIFLNPAGLVDLAYCVCAVLKVADLPVAFRIGGCASDNIASAVFHLNDPAFQALAIGIVELEALYAAGKGVGEVDQSAFGAIDQIQGDCGWSEIFVVALQDLADLICPRMQPTDLPEATAISDAGVYKPRIISDLYGPASQAVSPFIELVAGEAGQVSISELQVQDVAVGQIQLYAAIGHVSPACSNFLAEDIFTREESALLPITSLICGRCSPITRANRAEPDFPALNAFICAIIDLAATNT